jgi:hypothetical protein
MLPTSPISSALPRHPATRGGRLLQPFRSRPQHSHLPPLRLRCFAAPQPRVLCPPRRAAPTHSRKCPTVPDPEKYLRENHTPFRESQTHHNSANPASRGALHPPPTRNDAPRKLAEQIILLFLSHPASPNATLCFSGLGTPIRSHILIASRGPHILSNRPGIEIVREQ